MIWLSGKKQNGKAEKIDVIEEMMDMSTVKTDMETGIKLYVNIQSDNDDQEKENIYLRQGFLYRGMFSCLFSFE